MRLIDADTLIAHLKKDPLFGLVEQYGISGVIEAQPTVDAVPVIRCKDCVEFRRWDDECGECYDGLADGGMVRADGYCYAAERKKDDIQK